MSRQLRNLVKRTIPTPAKDFIRAFRAAVEGPPIDDVVLASYRMVPDASENARLNLVIPNLAQGSAFGGVTTGLDIVLRLACRLSEVTDLDVRVIFANPDRETDFSMITDLATRLGFAPDRLDSLMVTSNDATVPVRRDDLFIAYNFWTALNTETLLEAQAAFYDIDRRPLLYLIQEYEPQIFAFSSAHLIAREAYDAPKRLWGIFNSENLYRYYLHQGHSANRAFVFEPVINDKLRPYLVQVRDNERKPQILVYGRPGVRRNCFPALIRGLRRWARDYPQFSEWQVLSAGTPHKPVPLGDGRDVRSVGKLSLDDYAKTLLDSSVGVSLMSSPHPSYPPLEMAHMGLRLVTNTYLCKDLSDYHPNIVSTTSISEEALSRAIAEACHAASGPPSLAEVDDFVRTDPYPFLDELAEGLFAELTNSSG